MTPRTLLTIFVFFLMSGSALNPASLGQQSDRGSDQDTFVYQLSCKLAYSWRTEMGFGGDIDLVKRFLDSKKYKAVKNAQKQTELKIIFDELALAYENRQSTSRAAEALHRVAYGIIDLCACGKFKECTHIRCDPKQNIELTTYFGLLGDLAKIGEKLMK